MRTIIQILDDALDLAMKNMDSDEYNLAKEWLTKNALREYTNYLSQSEIELLKQIRSSPGILDLIDQKEKERLEKFGFITTFEYSGFKGYRVNGIDQL